MDTSLIVLGVALIIVLYFVFYYMTARDSLADRLDLAQLQTPITADKLTKPGNGKYSYELWMYVYGPKSITRDTYIFYRDDDASTLGAPRKTIGVKLLANEPTMELEYTQKITNPVGGGTTNASEKVVITDNFPFQSWVHLIVSVENKFIDIYMNGKLIKSVKNTKINLPSNSRPLEFGISQTHLAKFTRVAYPTDPQTAWNHYLDGNGENPFKKLTGDYNVALSFKDGDNASSGYKLNIIGKQ
jgi:hypothetical protein